MTPHSSTLAWKIPWMEEPGRLQSMGSRKVRHNWATSLSFFTFMHWRRKWQLTPVFFFFFFFFFTLQYCIGFAIHQHASATGLHMFPTLNPPPTSLSIPSLQCSCLENLRDWGAWWAAIYWITQSWTRLKWLSSSSSGRRIIALKYCFDFSHTSTWISHRYTYVPSLLKLTHTSHHFSPLYIVT